MHGDGSMQLFIFTMSNNQLFSTLTHSEIQSIIFLAYSAGIEAGKAKEKTTNLMSDVGRGVFATFKGRDANHCIGGSNNSDPDIINDMSNFALKIIEELCRKYNCNNFLK